MNVLNTIKKRKFRPVLRITGKTGKYLKKPRWEYWLLHNCGELVFALEHFCIGCGDVFPPRIKNTDGSSPSPEHIEEAKKKYPHPDTYEWITK